MSTLASPLLTGTVQAISPCCTTYTLTSVPAATQEGKSVLLILTVSGFSSTVSTTYGFVFFVKDPSGTQYQSKIQNYTTSIGQYQFSISLYYPSSSLSGTNSKVGQYSAFVDQVIPAGTTNPVATSSFYIELTDSSEYERTQTVNIQASGYNASENVNVVIRTHKTSILVFSLTLQASSSGFVVASWDIPVNATIATIDSYDLTLTGTSTFKSPTDTQSFVVNYATISITSITSIKTVYQRTETMIFSFQPTYPDGSIATTGAGVLNLMSPTRKNVTLTATYYSASQTFNTTYTTSASSQTGTWTATLFSHQFSDSYGNTGPSGRVPNTPQLTPASLTVSVNTNTNFLIGQQAKFNASITYPDGTALTSGTVGAYLLYSGTPVINDTIPLVFDTGLGLWVGTYTPKVTDTGGLWSLVFKASDSSNPADTGSATRAVTLQNNSAPPQSNNASFPLYYFGIIAALIAGLLAVSFLAFKRRKETHARLKIDLEAVRSEAGRIESQDFFKSIKEQVTKDQER